MEVMLVSIHQYQLSIFFLVISHMPVNADALANASAQGIAPGAKSCFRNSNPCRFRPLPTEVDQMFDDSCEVQAEQQEQQLK